MRSPSVASRTRYRLTTCGLGAGGGGRGPAELSISQVFLDEIFSPLIARVRQDSGREFEATGWGRVDRTILKAKTTSLPQKAKRTFKPLA